MEERLDPENNMVSRVRFYAKKSTVSCCDVAVIRKFTCCTEQPIRICQYKNKFFPGISCHEECKVLIIFGVKEAS